MPIVTTACYLFSYIQSTYQCLTLHLFFRVPSETMGYAYHSLRSIALHYKPSLWEVINEEVDSIHFHMIKLNFITIIKVHVYSQLTCFQLMC